MANRAPVIMTVDDDPHMLSIIEHHVRQWGYRHCGLQSSKQMFDKLERDIPSVILLDVALGDSDGTVLVTQLKESFPSVPVIMITANATVEAAVKSIKNGAYDF
ncbi:MAG: response regulator, partial [Planctomycetes bacterium]|nr:response regulator [Planctomycetota bacterium]